MQRTLLLALALLLSAPAEALVFVSGDGQGNTSPPPDDPGWNHVGRVSGLNGIYLGNGWVLTANHVPTGNPIHRGRVVRGHPRVGGAARRIPINRWPISRSFASTRSRPCR